MPARPRTSIDGVKLFRRIIALRTLANGRSVSFELAFADRFEFKVSVTFERKAGAPVEA